MVSGFRKFNRKSHLVIVIDGKCTENRDEKIKVQQSHCWCGSFSGSSCARLQCVFFLVIFEEIPMKIWGFAEGWK